MSSTSGRTYRIEIHRRAVRDLRRLDAATLRRVRAAIDHLAHEPRPRGCKKLAGEDDVFRIRVGDIRILYLVHDDRLVIVIIRVAHRRDVYRGID